MRASACLTAALAIVVAAPVAAQTQTYITNFTKTDNIYTNLNQQYPNTGPGVPGSTVGTPDSSYLFTPQATGQGNPSNLNYANNGISYMLTSDSLGRDFAQVGSASFGVASLVLPINVVGATNFYLLAAAYNGTSFNVVFTGTGGYTRTFSNIALPDFSGGSINSVVGDVSDQTVFGVSGIGAGGTGNSSTGANGFYSLTQVGFNLGDALIGQTLTSATITGNGYETLILGATAVSPAATVAAVPEPASWAMMIVGFGLIGGAMRTRRREALAA